MNALADLPAEDRAPGVAARDGLQARVAQALREVLPAACVLWTPAETRPYECDGLSMLRQLPMVVALPADEAQVARRAAHLRADAACRSSRAAPARACRAARCRTAKACCSRSAS